MELLRLLLLVMIALEAARHRLIRLLGLGQALALQASTIASATPSSCIAAGVPPGEGP